MPRFPYLDLITTRGAPGARPQVSQMTGDWPSGVAEQVMVAHEGWSALSTSGFSVPAVSTFPLQDPGGRMSGLHYAVSLTWWDGQIRHRCFLVPETDYAGEDFHPYALLTSLKEELQEAPSLTEWRERDNQQPETISLITDGLQQLLCRGRLHLPLGTLDPACDRILALLVSAVPVRTRSGLKFTSFSPIDPWLWNLAATHQPGGSLVDWKRRVLDLNGMNLGLDATAYLQSVADLLATGNLQGLEELSRRSTFHPALDAGVKPAARVLPPRQAPRGQAPAAAPADMAPREPAAPHRKPVSPAPAANSAPRRRVVLERRKLRNITIVGSHGRRGTSGRVVSVLGVLLLLAGGWWLGSLPGLSLQSVRCWLHRGNHLEAEPPPPTPLLSVVDVGRSYSRILREYQTRVGVDGRRRDKARQEALTSLKARAVKPLYGQVSTYLAVVQDGIQQGSQPQREVRRMETLADAGRDLARDLQRLELAWYSLATGVCWCDLGSLPDSLVGARYDSLASSGHDLDHQVAAALGLQGQKRELQLARKQAGAMGRLVDLFQAGSWSPEWQQELLSAAGEVSPSASPITRTYDNCAFAFARLKAAEHSPEALALPFGEGWTQGTWPSAEVRTVLPKLRRIVGTFPVGQVPPVVAGTVALYSSLENPQHASVRAAADADFWRGLNANQAVMFDPALCEDVLGRLRFEALRPYLNRGDPPVAWPGHLVTLAAAPVYLEFYGKLALLTDPDAWRAYAAEISDPFLGRWARQLSRDYGEAARNLLLDFSSAWEELVEARNAVAAQEAGGRAWTVAWLNLHTAVLDLLDRYVLSFGDRPVCRAQVAMAADMLATMSKPLKIHLTGMDVDLAAVGASGPATVDLAVEPAQAAPLRREFLLPVSGRVRAELDWSFDLEPGQWVVVRVEAADSGSVLWQAVCPALLEGGGPEVLAQGLTSWGGKIIFALDHAPWRQLEPADPGAVF